MKILRGTHPRMLMSAWYSESEMEAPKEALSRGRDLSNVGDADFGQCFLPMNGASLTPITTPRRSVGSHSH